MFGIIIYHKKGNCHQVYYITSICFQNGQRYDCFIAADPQTDSVIIGLYLQKYLVFVTVLLRKSALNNTLKVHGNLVNLYYLSIPDSLSSTYLKVELNPFAPSDITKLSQTFEFITLCQPLTKMLPL